MKDSALVVVDIPAGPATGPAAGAAREGTLRTIDRLTAGTEADDSGIHSTYPILFVRNPLHEVDEVLQPYVKEYLTFIQGEDLNPAGQSLAEVLRLLDIEHVLVCGIAPEECLRNTAEDLRKAGFDVQLL